MLKMTDDRIETCRFQVIAPEKVRLGATRTMASLSVVQSPKVVMRDVDYNAEWRSIGDR